MLESLSASFLYSLLKDIFSKIRKTRRLSSVEIIEQRQKWKTLFEDEIAKNHHEKLREDIIIRDVKRIDKYPKGDVGKKGISPWFRVGLVGTYHKGILVALDWRDIKKEGQIGWRYTDYKLGEAGDVTAVLIGKIPFENIANVDWQGDEYYNYPHVYCWFDTKRKEPYEEVVYCERRETPPNGRYYYIDIASSDSVRKLSKKMKIQHY